MISRGFTVIKVCFSCNGEYDTLSRKGNKGKITVCNECGEEEEQTVKYTGFTVYGHKTSCELQINADPRLTEYLINATKLKNKGSNMTNNIANCTKYKNLNKTEGSCVHVVDAVDYKNRSGI
jgi:hypothetical protein